jgi:cell division protease FtsH
MAENNPQRDSNGQDKNQPKRQQTPPPIRMNRSVFGWLMVLVVAVLLFVVFSNQNPAKPAKWGEVVALIEANNVESIVVKDDRIVVTVVESMPNRPQSGQFYYPLSGASKEAYVSELMEIAPDLLAEDPPSTMLLVLLNLLPWLLVLGLIWFFIFRAVRGSGGGMGMLGNFGRSRHRVISKEMTNITMTDVAGIEEAKEEVAEIIEFLKHPKKFQRLGGRIPRGVLLVGDPGCGKTLLAKAVAGEAEVPFYSISGSDFVEMFVGVGASRVRDLFKQAKDNSPCIIFLDEIDAVGRRRGGGFSSGGHDEREQTLNAILVEMDGFDTNDQVIVMAATNRADVLDPALTRPGRFDRQIHVPLPDVKGRMEILQVHAKKVKTSEEVDIEKLARGTPMFSGADLAAIINEAAIIATLANKDHVEMADLEEARDKVRFGRQSRSRHIDEQEKVSTAYHEAGHAVVQKLLEHADPLHKVTIIPRGQAMGATMSLPEKDRHGYGLRYIQAMMRVMCAGRIAEQRKTDDATSGAAMDIRMATRFARHMVIEWGMSDRLGFVFYAEDDQRDRLMADKPYSDRTAQMIDEEVRRQIDDAYADAERIIANHWDKVEAIAEALLKYETLSVDEVNQLMDGKTLNKPTVSDLLNAEAAKKKAAEPDKKRAQSTEQAGGEEPGQGVVPSPA